MFPLFFDLDFPANLNLSAAEDAVAATCARLPIAHFAGVLQTCLKRSYSIAASAQDVGDGPAVDRFAIAVVGREVAGEKRGFHFHCPGLMASSHIPLMFSVLLLLLPPPQL